MAKIVRALVVAGVLLLSTSCRDEDVADGPLLPDNVGASVERCEVVDGSPLASVEVTNGTGHAAAFDVMVRFVHDGVDEGIAVGRSPVVDPGAEATAEVVLADGGAVDRCELEDVSEADD